MRVLIANDYGTSADRAELGCLRLPEVYASHRAPPSWTLLGLGTPERMSGAPLPGFEARSAGVG